MIFVKNLSLQFGSQLIFDNVSFNLSDKDKIGLVGRNGTGKSTLLKIIAHQQDYDKGDIETSNSFKVAYMPQEVVITSDKNVVNETMASFEYLHQLKEESDQLEKIVIDDPTEEQMTRYCEIQHELLEHNFDEKRAQAQRILMGLGFDDAKQKSLVSQLSVGWRMRIVLAKLLLQDADFYLFDEPTNHLDLTAKNWFLDFLKEGKFGYLLVCHDRYFLDKACNKTFELSQAKLTIYHGNYSYYITQKQMRTEHLERAYEQQQREMKQQQKTIDRFKASASKATMMQSMVKKLEKVERIELEVGPRTMSLRLKAPERSGQYVLTVRDVSYGFNTKLFSNVSFEIQREDKIALVAPNGTGKTTLFNLIAKKLPLQHGSVSVGHNVSVALFDQDQEKILDPQKTILEEVIATCSKVPESQMRATLGALLFSGDDIYKKTKVLSGGERNRVAMAKVILQNANFLLLDEPTNHLDIESKEVILNGLKQYEGTILFVSHDQDFVNKLATKIIELTPKGVTVFDGNYEQYIASQEQLLKLKKDSSQKKTEVKTAEIKNNETDFSKKNLQEKTPNKNLYEIQKKSKNIEHKIAKLEEEIATLLEKMGNHAYGSDIYYTTNQEVQKTTKELEAAHKEWEYILTQLDLEN
jgi:ATP-binding cassette subfamily F protein 3